ncbi:efflux RND transporter periplasmic adaptor subunit [Planctomycetota bacterium]
MEKIRRFFYRHESSGSRVLNKRRLYWAIVAAVVVLTFLAGHFYQAGDIAAEKKIIPVEVEVVGSGSIERTIELSGWIKAKSIVDMTSKVSGRVESLDTVLEGGKVCIVEEGLGVKKGQKLALIDQDVFLAQVSAAQAQVKAREVELADADREMKRMVSLYENGSTTEQSKDKAVTAAELASASLELARANLELAQIDLRESTVVSPIDGVITARHIDCGNLVNAGQKIVTIAEVNTVKIVVSAAEKYAGHIIAGTEAEIKVDAYPEKFFKAQVYSVYPALDEHAHTIPVEIRLDNSEMLLKPGMFARVTLITERKEDAVVIARDVVLGGRIDDHYVYVIEKGLAYKRIVKVGIKQNDRYEITEGLKAGETLVVNGMHYLEDKAKVEIVRIEEVGLK